MRITRLFVGIICLAVAFDAAARAAEPGTTQAVTLHVGDRAPALNVERWLKGEPVARFEPGTIYVVEFWATWCGPCVAAIPDLTWYQAKRPGVVFIGVDVMDDAALVDPFVKRMGDRMKYRVAADASPAAGERGPVAKAWLDAAGVGGIPSSFVIDGAGRIAAIEHPGGLRPILDALQAGRPLPPPFADAEIADLTSRWKTYREACDRKDWPAANATLDGLYAIFATHVGGTDIEGYDVLRQHLRIAAGDFAAAQEAFDALDARVSADTVVPSKRAIADRQRLDLFARERDAIALNRFAAVAADRAADDAQALNAIAWDLIGEPVGVDDHLPGVDLDVVLKIARDADAAAEGRDDAILDTLARVRALRGEFAEAIACETRVVARCADERAKAAYRQTLADYQAGHAK